ncbi:restriction endonuclease subunit S, partial [bacterium]|nr:restriction endonuclease subunit S [bacterium]
MSQKSTSNEGRIMNTQWEEKTLDEICEINYGTRVVKNRDAGTIYPVYGGGGATFYMDTYNRENCMVIARFAMSEKCTRFVDGKFFLNDSGLTVKTKNMNLNQNFLDWQLLSLNDKIYSLGRGSAQKNLNVDLFKKIQIKYPLSQDEQQRIVGILDEAFENIEKSKQNTIQNLNNAKELFDSYLTSILLNKDNWVKRKLSEVAIDFGRGRSRHRP